MTSADVSVRVAWADDAAAVATLQVAAWSEAADGVVASGALPSGAEDVELVAQTWARALAKPGDARNRVLVALERNRVVGFAVVGPADDPDCDPVADGELRELVVGTDDRGRGHGSRLLQAVADTLGADRFRRAVTWAGATDDVVRAFLTAAGWATDSAHRTLDLDGTGATQVTQVRLHTALTP